MIKSQGLKINTLQVEYINPRVCKKLKIPFPKQGDTSDCAIFAMEFARLMMHEGDLNEISQWNIQQCRERIRQELENYKLVENYVYPHPKHYNIKSEICFPSDETKNLVMLLNTK